MKVRAVLVGIEKYGAGIKPAPPGPAKNALELAARLVDNGTPKGNLHLFLSPDAPVENPLGLTFENAAYATLNKFLRTELPGLLGADELFLMYWSGHGITIDGGDRVVFYQDYSDALSTYALSMREWAETLSDASRFKSQEQLLLIDACANRLPGIRPQPQEPRAGKKWVRANRYQISAALEGDYAANKDGSGVFSRHVLDFLAQGAKLDSAKQFYTDCGEYLKKADQRFYAAELTSPEGRTVLDATAGTTPEGKATDLLKALEKAPLPFEDLLALYRRTIEPLKMPELWNVNSTAGMTQELARLGNARPMVELAMRVKKACDKDVPELTAWIILSPEHVRATIERDLGLEAMEQYLVIDFLDDPKKSPNDPARGNVVKVEARLYPESFDKPLHHYESRDVNTWEQAAEAVAEIIEDAEARCSGKLHLQFLVNSTMLAYAPQQIKGADETEVGNRFPTVLRSQERFYKPYSQIAERWKRRAEEIQKAISPAAYPIPAQAGKALAEALNAGRGVYYLSGMVACTRESRSKALSLEMRALKEAMDLGVPFLCFLHGATDKDWEANLADRLKKWLKKGLKDFPGTVCDERANYDEYACGVSVFWDDPGQLPRRGRNLKEVMG